MSSPNIVTSDENPSFKLDIHGSGGIQTLVGAILSRFLYERGEKERMPHTVKSGLLGPKENNMSTGAGLARNPCSQTSQTFTLSICMFFPLCPVESVLSDGTRFSLTNLVCGLPAGCIPLEIFHLKLITIARCGVVPRVEFLLTSRRVHIKQPRIFVNHRVVQF